MPRPEQPALSFLALVRFLTLPPPPPTLPPISPRSYGKEGAGREIPPNQILIFRITLLGKLNG